MPEATYCTVAIAAVSQTQNIPASSCKRRRYTSCTIAAKSTVDTTGVARNRAIAKTRMESVATTSKASPKRRCRTSVLIQAKSQLECKRLAVLVSVPAPQGKMLSGGNPLSGARLMQGVSNDLNFTIDGERIIGLQIQFAVTTLAGAPVLTKTLHSLPGGILLEEPVSSGTATTLIGLVPLYPHETNRGEKEVELRYSLTMSDGFSRKYSLESGTFSLYQE